MERKVIATALAPAAIGPYSQAIVAGGFLFCSGQIPLDPLSGQKVGGEDAAAQAEQVMKNLGAVLEAGGASLANVVKTTIFLTDLGDFASVNAVYGRFFDADAPPARATVEVAALPKGVKVEIEAVALMSAVDR